MRRAVLRPLPGDEAPAPGRVIVPLDVRLWRKVNGPWYSTAENPIGPDDCWPWCSPARAGVYRVRDGRRCRAPYRPGESNHGRIRRGRRSEGVVAAHVAAYEVTYGPVPAGLLVRHLCGWGLCCNPGHLAAGTVAENAADRVRHRQARQFARAS